MKKILLLTATVLFFSPVAAFSYHGQRGYAPPMAYGYQQYSQQYVMPAGHGHGNKHWRRNYRGCDDDDRGYRGHVSNNYYYGAPAYVAPAPVIYRNNYYVPQPRYIPIYPQNSINLQFGF